MNLQQQMSEKYGIFMDVSELAEVLKISKRGIYQQLYLDTIELPYLREGKKYLFPTTEVATFLQQKLVGASHASPSV